MDSLQTISNDLVQSINEKEKKKSIPYDTYAKVIRIDGGTAWVHIPGGVDETPVALTVNAKVGDSVLVRVSGGNAWIVGNSSAPPTDDTKAVEAKGVADVAQVKAASAQETAETAEATAASARARASSALEIAEGTNEHFWHDNTGAHITQITQEEWNEPTDPNYHSGGNTLITTQGMAIRKGLTNLAEFGATGAVIGQNDDTRLYIDNDSVFSTNARGFSTFEINSLPSGTYNNKGEWFEYNNESPFECVFRWNCTSINNNVQCYDSAFNRIVGLNPQPTLSNNTAIFDSTQCAQLQSNSVKYILMGYTAVGAFPYFTFGERGAGTIGKYSTCIGEMCVASNDDSYAEGLSTEASGVGAHAEGNGANASGGYSHAEGYDTKASGTQAHSEGHNSIASGSIAHAEGFDTTASGYASHAQNFYTKASSNYQTALGKYNVEDNASAYAVIIGNGTADNARSNALTVDWSGNVEASGDITDGSGNVLADKLDVSGVLNIFYPVGSYYETSDTAFNPNTAWGGTWVLETAGKFHVSAGTGYAAGSTGGSANAIVPYHRHGVAKVTGAITGGAHTHDIANRSVYGGSSNYMALYKGGTGTSTNAALSETHTHDLPAHNTGYAGTSGNTTGANMPPYIAVNRWHRTA